MEYAEPFSNREKATALWVIAFAAWALINKSTRAALWAVVKSALQPKLAVSWLTMLVYVAIAVALLSRVGLWDGTLAKDTVYWVVGVGAVNLVQVGTGEGAKGLKAALRGAVGLTIALEFVLDLHTFGLLIELIIVPLSVLLVGMSVVAGTSEEHKQVRRLVDGALAGIGFALVLRAGWGVVSAPAALATADNLRLFALPPLLTVLYVPYLYLCGLCVIYETMFVRRGLFLRDDLELRRFAEGRIAMLCYVDFWRLERFSRFSAPRFPGLRDKADVLKLIDDFKDSTG